MREKPTREIGDELKEKSTRVKQRQDARETDDCKNNREMDRKNRDDMRLNEKEPDKSKMMR